MKIDHVGWTSESVLDGLGSPSYLRCFHAGVILLKANDGELKGAVYFHCLPPRAEVDFIYYPSKLLSFDEARALAENLLANAQSGHFKGYRWERAVP